MKHTKFLLFVLVFALAFQACNKDEDPNPPTISNFELGYEDSGEAVLGDDLHVEAEITADGKIDRIQVTLHPEGEHDKSAYDEDEWEIDTVYTKFSGLKNTEFHEHFEVPMDADTGHYHFHFVVIDMEGNSKSIEREVHIEEE